MRTKKTLLCLCTLSVFLACGSLMAADLTINLKGFKDASGGAIVWPWKNAGGFPTKMEKATLKQSAEIKDKSAAVVFKGLEPGVYALNIAHDENGNGKLDTGFRTTWG